MDAALLALMPQTCQVEAWASQDAYGQPTYGSASTHQCLIEGKVQLVRTASGEEKVSTVQVYLATAAGVTARDRITLSTEYSPTQPPILSVLKLADESGPYADVVYC